MNDAAPLMRDALAALYAQRNADFQAIVRNAAGIDEQLLYDVGMKKFVVGVGADRKASPARLKRTFRLDGIIVDRWRSHRYPQRRGHVHVVKARQANAGPVPPDR